MLKFRKPPNQFLNGKRGSCGLILSLSPSVHALASEGKRFESKTAPRRFMICIWAMGLLLCVAPSPLRAACTNEDYRFRPGVHLSCQYPFTNKQLQTLLNGLRFCTGFRAMTFDETGLLDLGDRTQVVGGSATSRSLIIAAVDSPDSFILESHDHSPTVAFAQIEAMVYEDGGGRKLDAWQVRLDFFDFTMLHGGDLILATFGPTMNLLHELIHGALRLKDPLDDSDPLGDCERHLNRIRAELGLPQRQTYLPKNTLRSTPESEVQVLQAEYLFVQTNGRAGRQKDLHMTFDLERVCGLGKSEKLSGCFRLPLVASTTRRKL